jgi:PDZ-binding kinase
MEKTPKTDFRTPLKLFKKKHLLENATPLQIPGSPLMKKLGYGTGIAVYLLNGSTKKAKTASGSPWAIKKCLKDKVNKDKTYATRLAAEAEVLRSLSHPNIVGFRSFTKAEDGR